MNGGWTTSDYALTVSLFSLSISIAGFVWNVWSKFIFPKPKVKVWVDLACCHLSSLHSASIRPDGSFAGGFPADEMGLPAVSMTVTNFGPGQITVTMGGGRHPFFHSRRPEGHGAMTAYESYPHDLSGANISSGGLPKKLDPGESFTLWYPANPLFFDDKEISSLGVRDTFSRLIWARRGNMRRLRKQFNGLKKLVLPDLDFPE